MPKFVGGGAEEIKLQKIFRFEPIDRHFEIVYVIQKSAS